MAIFLLTPLGNNAEALGAAMLKHFPESTQHYQLQNDAGWFVVFNGTTLELSNFVGITGQPQGTPSEVGSTLVTPLTSYYGRGSTDMWEWLKVRFESQP
jgi:hypothetical protein